MQGTTILDTCELSYAYDTIRSDQVPKIKLVEREVYHLNNSTTIECYEEIYQSKCNQLRDIGLALEELNNYDNFKSLMSEETFKVLMNRKQNRKNKRNRTKKKFLELFLLKQALHKESKIVFGTITLDDKHLDLKEDTYMRDINKWLKEHFHYSILNKDYGKKNGREHYHFIGLTTEELEEVKTSENKPKKSKKGYVILELKKKNYKLGFEPTLCEIDFDISDSNKTINYLLKLNNHSSKITTRNRVRIVKSPLMRFIELRPNKE